MACCRKKPTVKGSERQLAAANSLVYHLCAEQLLHDAYRACSLNQSLYRKHEAVASCCISIFIEFGTIKIQIVFRALLSLFSHCSQDNGLFSLFGEWCQERHRSFICV